MEGLGSVEREQGRVKARRQVAVVFNLTAH